MNNIEKFLIKLFLGTIAGAIAIALALTLGYIILNIASDDVQISLACIAIIPCLYGLGDTIYNMIKKYKQ